MYVWQVLHKYQPLLGHSLLLLLLLLLCGHLRLLLCLHLHLLRLHLRLLCLWLLRLLLSTLLRLQVCLWRLLGWQLLLLLLLLLCGCLWAAERQCRKLAAGHKHVKVIQLTAVAHSCSRLDTPTTARGSQQCEMVCHV
jgi:hypothetical protein